MSSSQDVRQELRSALKMGAFARLERRSVEDGHMDGKVVALSSRIVCVSLLGDDIRPNGLTFLRVSDITKATCPAPYADFYTRALSARRLRLSKPPKERLSTWRAITEFAAATYPLLTLHTEESDPDGCYVGRVRSVSAARCVLTAIGPDAKWDLSEALVVPFRDVTRIDCGGAYEEALALAATKLARGDGTGSSRAKRHE